MKLTSSPNATYETGNYLEVYQYAVVQMSLYFTGKTRQLDKISRTTN